MLNDKKEDNYNSLDSEEIKDNIVIIAGREPEVYTLTIIKKLRRFDQLEINFLDKYTDRALIILKLFEPLGILPTEKFKRQNGMVFFAKKEVDITPREDGVLVPSRKYKQIMNRIIVSKIPDLFRFTDI